MKGTSAMKKLKKINNSNQVDNRSSVFIINFKKKLT